MTVDAAAADFDALIGLGSNVGDKAANIARAVELLIAPGDIRLLRSSKLYSTAPWGVLDQDWFVNACIAIATTLSPHELLARCLGVEETMRRVRERRWGPRVIDLDVLVYRDVTMNEPDLILPHPRIQERGFVLVPMSDVAPDVKIAGEPIANWLARVDARDVVPFEQESQ